MTKDEILKVRMDKKLKKQLQRYADRNDEGIASVSARKALKMFLAEQEKKEVNCIRCNDVGCPACDVKNRGSKYNPEPY